MTGWRFDSFYIHKTHLSESGGMVYAADLKSANQKRLYGFDSHFSHQVFGF